MNSITSTTKALWKHSDVVQSALILSLNTTILISKIWLAIPRAIPRSAFAYLNYVGILSLPVQWSDIKKCAEDTSLAFSSRDKKAVFLTATKVAVKAINAFLTTAMFSAALISLVGFHPLSLAIYATLRPLAASALFTGIGLEASDFYENNSLLKELDSSVVKAGAVAREFFTKQGPFGVRIRRRLEAYKLDEFQEKMSLKTPGNQVFASITKSLLEKQESTAQNLHLVAFNYFAIGVCRLYPDTLIQSALMTGISAYYTRKLIIEKLVQTLDSNFRRTDGD